MVVLLFIAPELLSIAQSGDSMAMLFNFAFAPNAFPEIFVTGNLFTVFGIVTDVAESSQFITSAWSLYRI